MCDYCCIVGAGSVKHEKLNITLPDELCLKLKTVPNKSRVISNALNDKFKNDEQQKLDDLLIEGYKSTKENDKNLNEVWGNITLEIWE